MNKIKIKKKKTGGEGWSKCEALTLNPSTAKKGRLKVRRLY
jgi:hypothetical protein